MCDNDGVYVLGYDETVLTRDIDGVVEHKHTGFNYWHPVSMRHNGCGRTDSGVDSDVRICAVCDCNDHASMCHARRRQLGLTTGFVEHYVSGMERTTNECIDITSTLLMIDEAVSELISAKSMIVSIGSGSDHVQQARFEQFARTVDAIVLDLLKISMQADVDMEAERGENK